MNAHPPRPATSRRRFFVLASGACAASMTPSSYGQGLQRVSRSAKALGTTVTMTALHADESRANAALDAAFAELEHIENVMSIYRAESQLSRLNRDSLLEGPDPLLVEVLQYAAKVAERSGGAFDITVQPLWKLRGAKPDAATMSLVDWRKVEISADQIRLAPGMAITLNGIAQGFAADAAMRVMRAHRVEHALIDAGEFSAHGMNVESAPWRIGIQHPREPDAYAALTRLENRCLATSGDYETSFNRDFSRHHILDPRTGQSPGELASVSVLAPTAMAADALSTAVFVMGPQRGLELLRSYPETDALIILKNGRHLATAGFPFAA